MKKELTVYLDGKMSGLSYSEMNNWRIKAKSLLKKLAEERGYTVNVINPVDFYNFEEIKHKSEREVMDFDLRLARKSDFLFGTLKGLDTSQGTGIEIYDCNKYHDIPVYTYGSQEELNKVHPWIRECITRNDDTLQDALDYIRDFVMI